MEDLKIKNTDMMEYSLAKAQKISLKVIDEVYKEYEDSDYVNSEDMHKIYKAIKTIHCISHLKENKI